MNRDYTNKNPIIISQPSAEDLKPTLEQLAEQRALKRWEERSREFDWVVGEPYVLRP